MAVRHHPFWLLKLNLLGLTQLVMATAGLASMDPGIGRLERSPKRCITAMGDDNKRPCSALRLDRKSDHVLRVRFTGMRGAMGTVESFSFVSTNSRRSLPLTCRQGQCNPPTGTWQGTVIGAAQSVTDALGLVQGLPKAWPARGTCSISPLRVVCEAHLTNGNSFRGEASF